LTKSGHFTQIPSGKVDECYGDVSPIDCHYRMIACVPDMRFRQFKPQHIAY
jgi:hypothetical protein